MSLSTNTWNRIALVLVLAVSSTTGEYTVQEKACISCESSKMLSRIATVGDCASRCDASPFCRGFQYYTEHMGLGTTYKQMDCVLLDCPELQQLTVDPDTCDGSTENLNLHLRVPDPSCAWQLKQDNACCSNFNMKSVKYPKRFAKLGNGACRDGAGGHGAYHHVVAASLEACMNQCSNFMFNRCKGVEYFDDINRCEIHVGDIEQVDDTVQGGECHKVNNDQALNSCQQAVGQDVDCAGEFHFRDGFDCSCIRHNSLGFASECNPVTLSNASWEYVFPRSPPSSQVRGNVNSVARTELNMDPTSDIQTDQENSQFGLFCQCGGGRGSAEFYATPGVIGSPVNVYRGSSTGKVYKWECSNGSGATSAPTRPGVVTMAPSTSTTSSPSTSTTSSPSTSTTPSPSTSATSSPSTSTNAPTTTLGNTASPTSTQGNTAAPTTTLNNTPVPTPSGGNFTVAPTTSVDFTDAPTPSEGNFTVAPTTSTNFTLSPTADPEETLEPTASPLGPDEVRPPAESGTRTDSPPGSANTALIVGAVVGGVIVLGAAGVIARRISSGEVGGPGERTNSLVINHGMRRASSSNPSFVGRIGDSEFV